MRVKELLSSTNTNVNIYGKNKTGSILYWSSHPAIPNLIMLQENVEDLVIEKVNIEFLEVNGDSETFLSVTVRNEIPTENDDVKKEFDWDMFREQNIHVYCETEEERKDFESKAIGACAHTSLLYNICEHTYQYGSYKNFNNTFGEYWTLVFWSDYMETPSKNARTVMVFVEEHLSRCIEVKIPDNILDIDAMEFAENKVRKMVKDEEIILTADDKNGVRLYCVEDNNGNATDWHK